MSNYCGVSVEKKKKKVRKLEKKEEKKEKKKVLSAGQVEIVSRRNNRCHIYKSAGKKRKNKIYSS